MNAHVYKAFHDDAGKSEEVTNRSLDAFKCP